MSNDLCEHCLREPCICEPDTPELRAEMLGLLTAKGYDVTKRLGPQLGLDTREGQERLTKHLAERGILPQAVRINPDGTVDEVEETKN